MGPVSVYQFITKAALREAASGKTLTEEAALRKAASASAPDGTTFLSHSSQDTDLTTGAMTVLKNHGATVYIDEIDPSMPPYTNAETAAKLKNRIRVCKKFVLLATPNSNQSKWVPWELGIGDGYKSLSNIAIFPASENSTDKSWASWEYLGLYHKIVFGDLDTFDKKVWMVIDERKNTATELAQWIRS